MSRFADSNLSIQEIKDSFEKDIQERINKIQEQIDILSEYAENNKMVSLVVGQLIKKVKTAKEVLSSSEKYIEEASKKAMNLSFNNKANVIEYKEEKRRNSEEDHEDVDENTLEIKNYNFSHSESRPIDKVGVKIRRILQRLNLKRKVS